MPTFDIVSQFNEQVGRCFDFKGTDSKCVYEKEIIKVMTESDFQLQQRRDILNTKLTKRGIDLRHMEPKDPVIQLKSAIQEIKMKKGIETETAKKIVKFIKESKL